MFQRKDSSKAGVLHPDLNAESSLSGGRKFKKFADSKSCRHPVNIEYDRCRKDAESNGAESLAVDGDDE